MTIAENIEQPALHQLNSRTVPVLGPGTPYLLKFLSSEKIEFAELAGIVENVPSIAARLIALANSVWSSPISTITSVEHACSRLGLGVVRSTSLALAVGAVFDASRCPKFDAEYFWNSALMTADAASRIAPLTSAANLDAATARAAGLLHNLGLLWLADQIPDGVEGALQCVENDEYASLTHALRATLGFDSAAAGAHLGSAWALPEPLLIAIGHHPSTDFQGDHWELAAIVGLAASLVRAVQQEESWDIPHSHLSRLRIDSKAAERVFTQIEKQQEKNASLVSCLFSS